MFRLRIASFGRGTLAGTRCTQFNYKNKGWTSQQSSEVSEKTNSKPKKPRSMKNLSEEAVTYQFLSPLVGSSGEVASVATYRSTSRSLASRDTESRSATGRPAQSQSPSRGLDRPLFCKDGVVVSGAAQLPGHGTAR
jgi:hypothetical protein